MMWFKKCPKCVGDLHEGSDQYGPFVKCAQCGYTLNAMQETALRKGSGLAPVKPVPAVPVAKRTSRRRQSSRRLVASAR